MQLVAGFVTSLALLACATPTEPNLSDSSSSSSSLFSSAEVKNITSHVRNANHIFNSLHSSMRQWGSAWHHNGMSFFLASVPAGTQFYHGTRSASRINGTEWLAFEPEHALNFAKMGGPHRKGSHGGSSKRPPPPPPAVMNRGKQRVLHDLNTAEGIDSEEDKYGYLHTYTAAKDLRLLYIDGLSGGKTDMGTMDSGDRIFLRDETLNQVATDEPSPGKKYQAGPGSEYARATIGCEIAQKDWNGRIDGILRAEAGFEIILCDFARDLKLEHINAVSKDDDRFQFGFGNSGYFYRSIATRFDGIGGERVKVNYDNFVTAFAYEDLDLFDGGKNEMPRLTHLSAEELQPVRDDLTRFVMEQGATERSFNWQAIVDMVVLKYSNLLMYLVSDEIETLENLQLNITDVFLAFIDERHRDAAAETERCASQFIPAFKTNALARTVIYDVSYTICSTLRSVLDDTDLSFATARISNLIDYLAWTTWKECKTKCGYSEACFIPIWPFGTVEDRLNPQCKGGGNGFENGKERYWRGGFGGGPPPHPSHEWAGEL